MFSRVCVCAYERERFFESKMGNHNKINAKHLKLSLFSHSKQSKFTKKTTTQNHAIHKRTMNAQYHFKLCAMCVNEKRKQSISMACPESCKCNDEQRICLQIYWYCLHIWISCVLKVCKIHVCMSEQRRKRKIISWMCVADKMVIWLSRVPCSWYTLNFS